MAKRISKITRSLKELGEVQVTDWDFMELLNRDIKDLEIGNSLRKLGNTKVMEWDFRDAMPAVHEFAHQEVDLLAWMKRTSASKVVGSDFKASPPPVEPPGAEEMEKIADGLKSFLQYVVVNLIRNPDRAQFSVQDLGPGVVRFKLVVTDKDAKELIGMGGFTAAALRNLLKGAAAAKGIQALLVIRSHAEDVSESLRETR